MNASGILPSLRFARHLGLMAVAAAVLCASAASGGPVTFAQFLQASPGAEPFVYTNNTTSATYNAASFPILLVLNPNFVPHGTNRFQLATFTLTSSTTSPASQSGGILSQNFPTATLDTIQITLSSPINGSTDFLTVTYSGTLLGKAGGSTAGLSASQSGGDTVDFSSGVINLAHTDDYGFSLGFSAITPGLELGPGSFLESFTGSGSGTFQLAQLVPEPGTLALLGSTLFCFVAIGLWKLKSQIVPAPNG